MLYLCDVDKNSASLGEPLYRFRYDNVTIVDGSMEPGVIEGAAALGTPRSCALHYYNSKAI